VRLSTDSAKDPVWTLTEPTSSDSTRGWKPRLPPDPTPCVAVLDAPISSLFRAIAIFARVGYHSINPAQPPPDLGARHPGVESVNAVRTSYPSPTVVDDRPRPLMTETPLAVTPHRHAATIASPAWTLIAVLGLATFVAAVITAGVRNPSDNPLSEGVSALGAQDAVAPVVMNLGFLVLAVGTVAAGLALLSMRSTKSSLAAPIIIILAGLGETAVAFVRQDCSTALAQCVYAEQANTVSTSHTVHQLIALAVAASLVVGLWMLAASLGREPDTAALARMTWRVAAVATFMFVLLGSQLYGDLGGIVEKVLIALVFGWPVVVAVALHRKRFLAPPAPSL
jgi:Protein of unknown function (DUF998)